ncbi:hypothetical protein GCK32_016343 [Trichostrongylus colubriformis]|uniref:Uncharacterized protein n=1 Tax=Trichostrongylus colubriformis TaxID=6319 RepID=A0AAN8ICJ6_TRICO
MLLSLLILLHTLHCIRLSLVVNFLILKDLLYRSVRGQLKTAFARIIVSYTGESNVAEHVPVDIRPASGVVIDRGESKQVSVRVRSPLYTHWRSSQNSIVSTASTARGASKLQVIVYWGEERTRQRLRCFEKISGNPHTREGLQFTDSFVGEVPAFRVPDDHPISKEDVRLFDQTLRTCIIYVCSPRIRPRPEPLRLRNHLGEVCSLRAPSVRKLPTNL